MHQPRPAHYRFAHQILSQDAHRPQGDTWPTLTGPNGPAYLAMKWDMAGGDPQLSPAIRIVLNQPLAGHHVLVVSMPQPLAPTEAYFVAYACPPRGPLRFFVMERGVGQPGEPERAFVSEYRADGMRIRHGDLPATTVEAFVGAIVQDLTAAPAAHAPAMQPPGMPSTMPVTMPHGAPPKRGGGSGKWFALGGLGLLLAAGASYMVWQDMRMQAWQERRDAREAAEEEARDANKAARKTAKARLDEVGKPYQTCLAEERERAKKALELARSQRSLDARNVRPKKKDVALLVNAMAYRLPTDKTPVALAFNGRGATDWIPVSDWIARKGTACKAPPKAYEELQSALAAAAPNKYDYDRKKQYEEHTEKLTNLTASLEGKGTQNVGKPNALVVVEESCKQTVVAHYDDISNNPLYAGGVDLKRYNCTASATWITLDGKRLASVTARGSAHPGRQPPTTTASDLNGINTTTHATARKKATDQLQKTINTWGGGKK